MKHVQLSALLLLGLAVGCKSNDSDPTPTSAVVAPQLEGATWNCVQEVIDNGVTSRTVAFMKGDHGVTFSNGVSTWYWGSSVADIYPFTRTATHLHVASPAYSGQGNDYTIKTLTTSTLELTFPGGRINETYTRTFTRNQ